MNLLKVDCADRVRDYEIALLFYHLLHSQHVVLSQEGQAGDRGSQSYGEAVCPRGID
jgi:hypothetical protein